jgi:hypothetical protein
MDYSEFVFNHFKKKFGDITNYHRVLPPRERIDLEKSHIVIGLLLSTDKRKRREKRRTARIRKIEELIFQKFEEAEELYKEISEDYDLNEEDLLEAVRIINDR